MALAHALFSHCWTSGAFTVWWSSSGSLRSGLSLWIRWRELGGEREERECSGLLADRAYGEPAGLSSLRGDPATQGRTHVHTWSSVKNVWCGAWTLFGQECEEDACLLPVCAHPTDFVPDDRQKTRVGVTGWRTDEEIARRKWETAELDSEGRGNQVELEIN